MRPIADILRLAETWPASGDIHTMALDVLDLLAEVSRLTVERDEARVQLDGRIQWQAEAVLNLQTWRALFDAAVEMRRGHEGCVMEPSCGSCFRCDFDKAVDQAAVEVAAGVDKFIQESLGFWGRAAARAVNERDAARAEVARLGRLVDALERRIEASERPREDG